MSEISRCFGIAIAMFYDDHVSPHFHARYAGHKATIAIATRVVLDGTLPPRALGLVTEWAALHRDELSQNWRRARDQVPLEPIAPLE
jgi:hypothetical protein